MPRTYHWPNGPHPVHSGTDTRCEKFICFKAHDYIVDCACGHHVRDSRLSTAADSMSAHIADVRRQLAEEADT